MEKLYIALAIGLPALGAGIAIGVIGKAVFEGISRNPEAADNIKTLAFVALGMAEAIAIYGFVIAIISVFR